MVCSEEARRWLEIISAKGVGAARWVELLRSVPVEEIVEKLHSPVERERLSRCFKRRVQAPDSAFVETQLRLLEKERRGLVTISDDAYPRLLREISDPPPLIFFEGELSALSKPSICIVGSRRATRRGIITAGNLARELSARGIQVVSGLARGIDGAAHAGALEGGGGSSAVLGCGVDVVYPPEHARLAEEITRDGCIASEFPLGTTPLKHHFPQRNRILSGLSLGVVVVEADFDGGAMGTAQWACDQNREVFAVPGPIDYPGSRGPHKLIREGATLVEEVADILGALPAYVGSGEREALHTAGPRGEPMSDEARAVLSALDLNPKHIDELVRFCHISPAVMLPLLLDLEMRGIIEPCGGGTYALAPPKRKF
jgi:DNA processing protein